MSVLAAQPISSLPRGIPVLLLLPQYAHVDAVNTRSHLSVCFICQRTCVSCSLFYRVVNNKLQTWNRDGWKWHVYVPQAEAGRKITALTLQWVCAHDCINGWAFCFMNSFLPLRTKKPNNAKAVSVLKVNGLQSCNLVNIISAYWSQAPFHPAKMYSSQLHCQGSSSYDANRHIIDHPLKDPVPYVAVWIRSSQHSFSFDWWTSWHYLFRHAR